MGFLLAKKSEEYHAEGINRSYKSSGDCCKEKPKIAFFTGPGHPDDRIFTKPASGYQRYGCQRCRTDQKCPVYNRNFTFQATHFEHILFVMEDHDDSSGSKE